MLLNFLKGSLKTVLPLPVQVAIDVNTPLEDLKAMTAARAKEKAEKEKNKEKKTAEEKCNEVVEDATKPPEEKTKEVPAKIEEEGFIKQNVEKVKNWVTGLSVGKLAVYGTLTVGGLGILYYLFNRKNGASGKSNLLRNVLLAIPVVGLGYYLWLKVRGIVGVSSEAAKFASDPVKYLYEKLSGADPKSGDDPKKKSVSTQIIDEFYDWMGWKKKERTTMERTLESAGAAGQSINAGLKGAKDRIANTFGDDVEGLNQALDDCGSNVDDIIETCVEHGLWIVIVDGIAYIGKSGVTVVWDDVKLVGTALGALVGLSDRNDLISVYIEGTVAYASSFAALDFITRIPKHGITGSALRAVGTTITWPYQVVKKGVVTYGFLKATKDNVEVIPVYTKSLVHHPLFYARRTKNFLIHNWVTHGIARRLTGGNGLQWSEEAIDALNEEWKGMESLYSDATAKKAGTKLKESLKANMNKIEQEIKKALLDFYKTSNGKMPAFARRNPALALQIKEGNISDLNLKNALSGMGVTEEAAGGAATAESVGKSARAGVSDATKTWDAAADAAKAAETPPPAAAVEVVDEVFDPQTGRFVSPETAKPLSEVKAPAAAVESAFYDPTTGRYTTAQEVADLNKMLEADSAITAEVVLEAEVLPESKPASSATPPERPGVLPMEGEPPRPATSSPRKSRSVGSTPSRNPTPSPRTKPDPRWRGGDFSDVAASARGTEIPRTDGTGALKTNVIPDAPPLPPRTLGVVGADGAVRDYTVGASGAMVEHVSDLSRVPAEHREIFTAVLVEAKASGSDDAVRMLSHIEDTKDWSKLAEIAGEGGDAAKTVQKLSAIGKVARALDVLGIVGDAASIAFAGYEAYQTHQLIARTPESSTELRGKYEERYYYLAAEAGVGGVGLVAGVVGLTATGAAAAVATPVMLLTLPVSASIAALYQKHKFEEGLVHSVEDWKRELDPEESLVDIRELEFGEVVGQETRIILKNNNWVPLALSTGMPFLDLALQPVRDKIYRWKSEETRSMQQTEIDYMHLKRIRAIVDESGMIKVPVTVRDPNGAERPLNTAEVMYYDNCKRVYEEAKTKYLWENGKEVLLPGGKQEQLGFLLSQAEEYAVLQHNKFAIENVHTIVLDRSKQKSKMESSPDEALPLKDQAKEHEVQEEKKMLAGMLAIASAAMESGDASGGNELLRQQMITYLHRKSLPHVLSFRVKTRETNFVAGLDGDRGKWTELHTLAALDPLIAKESNAFAKSVMDAASSAGSKGANIIEGLWNRLKEGEMSIMTSLSSPAARFEELSSDVERLALIKEYQKKQEELVEALQNIESLRADVAKAAKTPITGGRYAYLQGQRRDENKEKLARYEKILVEHPVWIEKHPL